jgi:hypothetical protein
MARALAPSLPPVTPIAFCHVCGVIRVALIDLAAMTPSIAPGDADLTLGFAVAIQCDCGHIDNAGEGLALHHGDCAVQSNVNANNPARFEVGGHHLTASSMALLRTVRRADTKASAA